MNIWKRSSGTKKRHEQQVIPHDIPPIQPPQFNLETGPPKWREVHNMVWSARSASALRLNGLTYKLYKNVPAVLRYFWRLMRMWRRAGGVLIHATDNSVNSSQSAFLKLRGKSFFSVIDTKNKYIDTSVEKAFLSSPVAWSIPV